jgi:DUF4097 and DUF4098 domain-containing protein YvlB
MKTGNIGMYLLVLALCWEAVPARAGREINEKLKASAEGSVEVYNLSGLVRIVGWERQEVEVKGTLGDGVEELVFKRDGNRVLVRTKIPESVRNLKVEESELEIRVPADSRIEVETISAHVEVIKVKGPLELETISGNISIGDQPKEIEAHSVSGDVEIKSETPRVAAKSVSGSIEAATQKLDRGDFESVSGDIRFGGELKEGSRLEVKNFSGDIELLLPKKVDAHFRVSTFSGDITNEFGPVAHSVSDYTPEKKLEFTAGAGSARVTVRTFSGDLLLRKK